MNTTSPIQLGILVVYLAGKENEALLKLHLSQIESSTTVPYRIYAATNRLNPSLKKKYLMDQKRVKLCSVPQTQLRGREEHAYYLDRLAYIASQDDVTHLVTLHLDSFPITTNWVQQLTSQIKDRCVMVAVRRDESFDKQPSTICMCFSNEYYRRYYPTFLLPNGYSKKNYRRYLRSHPHGAASGVGYGYALFCNNFSWRSLVPTKRRYRNSTFSIVYGGLIFHLGSATHYNRVRMSDVANIPRLLQVNRLMAALPFKSQYWMRQKIQKSLNFLVSKKVVDNEQVFLREKKALLRNPDYYLSSLASWRGSEEPEVAM